MPILLGVIAYVLAGMIVLESLRIWLGLGFDSDGDYIFKLTIWPALVLMAPFVNRDR